MLGSGLRNCALLLLTLTCIAGLGVRAGKADPLLDEIVDFAGQILFIQAKVPGLVIGAVRNGEVSVRGFGERAGPGSAPPDGDTLLRIGSVTKAFTGEVLAHLTAAGTVKLTDPLVKRAPDFTSAADPDVERIRLVDLATHAGGLPRELPHEPGNNDDPFAPITRDGFAAWLKKHRLQFAPGRSVLYSNFGFDLLAIALAEAAKRPYPDLLRDIITGPLAMKDTGFTLSDEQKGRLMRGHGFDGAMMPIVPTWPTIVGSGGLYSTPNDLLRWMRWHLDRFGTDGAEARLIDHALYVMRDGLEVVSGTDESGHMDGLGLAWIGMMAGKDTPFILQKAGGLQGTFCYIAFAPTRGVAVFVAINAFDFAAGLQMGKFANDLLATLVQQ